MDEKQARKDRFNEYMALKRLPFLDREQAKRFKWLQKQRVLDNKAAMQGK